ncbi:MAG: PaaI family thioesterase [bacterium]
MVEHEADLIPEGFLLESGTDPAEDHIGPFYLRRDPEHFSAGLMPGARHGNGMGNVHGGVLLTFADFALCAQARYGTQDDHIVTVSLNVDFISAAKTGQWLHSEGAVTRRTGSLVFLQGSIRQGAQTVVTYSGVGKRWQNN